MIIFFIWNYSIFVVERAVITEIKMHIWYSKIALENKKVFNFSRLAFLNYLNK